MQFHDLKWLFTSKPPRGVSEYRGRASEMGQGLAPDNSNTITDTAQSLLL